MRELIRPALFVVARVGMFLSLVATIAGQFWQSSLNTGFAVLVVERAGVGFSMHAASDYGLHIAEHSDSTMVEDYIAFEIDGKPRSGDIGILNIARVGLSRTEFVFGGRHWLIVTFFGLFYGVLKWVYRKREPEVADE